MPCYMTDNMIALLDSLLYCILPGLWRQMGVNGLGIVVLEISGFITHWVWGNNHPSASFYEVLLWALELNGAKYFSYMSPSSRRHYRWVMGAALPCSRNVQWSQASWERVYWLGNLWQLIIQTFCGTWPGLVLHVADLQQTELASVQQADWYIIYYFYGITWVFWDMGFLSYFGLFFWFLFGFRFLFLNSPNNHCLSTSFLSKTNSLVWWLSFFFFYPEMKT